MRLIDTHAHVHFPAYEKDIHDVMERIAVADMGVITVGTKISTSQSAVAFAQKYQNVWSAIGFHPSHAHDHGYVDEEEEHAEEATQERVFDEAAYAKLVIDPKVVAIGEFGLDYSRAPEGVDVETFRRDQQNQARAQLQFASKYNKPVIIHCRGGVTADVSGAHDDMRRLIQEEIDRGGLGRRGVIHCFTGTAEEAQTYAELGFLVSVTGIVTFSSSLARAVKAIPLEQIMLETDCPYLAPAPYRGKRNEPVYVERIAEVVAELKGLSVEEVAAKTTETAMRFFKI